MTYISVRTQTILMFIPILNGLNFLAWINNWLYLRLPLKMGLQSMLIVILSVLAVVIPTWILVDCFPEWESIIRALCSYLIPFVMSLGLIIYQKKNDLDF